MLWSQSWQLNYSIDLSWKPQEKKAEFFSLNDANFLPSNLLKIAHYSVKQVFKTRIKKST